MKLLFLAQNFTLYRSERFDLLTLGSRYTEGDYNLANFFVGTNVFSASGEPKLGAEYADIIVDSPAGIEHLNRKVVPNIDDLFVVLDPSYESIKHVERVKKITKNVGIHYGDFYLVGNYGFDDDSEKYLENTNETYLGRIEYDVNVRDYNLRGKSLLEIPEDSPACVSIKRILVRAGYTKKMG